MSFGGCACRTAGAFGCVQDIRICTTKSLINGNFWIHRAVNRKLDTLTHISKPPFFRISSLSVFLTFIHQEVQRATIPVRHIYLYIYFLGIGRSRISSLWGSVEDGRERSNHHVAHSYRRQHSLDGMGQLVAINVVALAFNFNLLLLDVESIKSCTSHQRHSRTKVFAIIRQSSRSGCLQWR